MVAWYICLSPATVPTPTGADCPTGTATHSSTPSHPCGAQPGWSLPRDSCTGVTQSPSQVLIPSAAHADLVSEGAPRMGTDLHSPSLPPTWPGGLTHTPPALRLLFRL